MTITHDALDLSVQRPSLTYQTWDPSQAHPSPIPQTPLQTSHMGPNPKLATSGGPHWRPVQTCSFEDQPPLVLKSGGQSNRCQAGGMHPPGCLITVRNEVAKVMFLHLSVCPQGGGVCLSACWDTTSPSRRLLLRTVRILLECILLVYNIYRLQGKVMFSEVFVCPPGLGGWGPPPARDPPPGRDPPPDRDPTDRDPPPPDRHLVTATAAVVTHPTGIHSCSSMFLTWTLTHLLFPSLQ